jgi:hypothetical protein
MAPDYYRPGSGTTVSVQKGNYKSIEKIKAEMIVVVS